MKSRLHATEIKEAREAAKVSHEELAEAMKLPLDSIKEWEAGTRECGEDVKNEIIEKLLDMARDKGLR